MVIVGGAELGPYGSSRTRFEMEVDTTAANEKWQVEVEQNLQKQAATTDTAEQPAK